MTYPQPNESDLDLIRATESWLADIPAPADALPGTLQSWVPEAAGRYTRGFTAWTRSIQLSGGQVAVEVHGLQWDDGAIERTVVYDVPVEMCGQDAITIGAALTETADRIELRD